MRGSVHPCLALALLVASAPAVQPPPGLVVWGTETYTLEAGESLQFHVDFEQIPVRRWLLLIEGDVRRSHLNLRRAADGRLVYDQRNESRHQVEIPWGAGESLSGVLTAARDGGAFAISLWGPPRDQYLQAYGYEVNRALESLAAGDRGAALAHLQAAQRDDPADPVARTLLQGLGAGGTLSDAPTLFADAAPDSATIARTADLRARVAILRAEGQTYAAIDTLQQALDRGLGRELLASLYAELVPLYLEVGNPTQAAAAREAAAALGLPAAETAALRRLLQP